MMKLLLLAALLATCSAQVINHRFNISDDGCAAGADFDCASSYHCIDIDNGTIYGTWGMFGMFDGTIAGTTANINWLNQDKVAGTATIQYTDTTYTEATLTSSSDPSATAFIGGSFIGGTNETFSPQSMCLKPQNTSSQQTVYGNWLGDGGEWHCETLTGVDYGSYLFAIEDDDDEQGTLVGQLLSSDTVFVGDWAAVSGPYAPNLGVQMERTDNYNGAPAMYGMYCEFSCPDLTNPDCKRRTLCETFSYDNYAHEVTNNTAKCMSWVSNLGDYNPGKESYADSEWPKVWLGVTIAIFAVALAVVGYKYWQADKELKSRPTATSSSREASVTVNPIGSK